MPSYLCFGACGSQTRYPNLTCEFTDDLKSERVSLCEWLHETYFEDGKKHYFSEANIDTLGALLQSVMQYRPSDRPRASDLLNHNWFQHSPFTLQLQG